MLYETSEAGIHRYTTEKGFMSIWSPGHSIVVCRVEGDVTYEVVPPMLEVCNHAIRSGTKLDFFNDWYAFDRYDTKSRLVLTQWALAHRAQLSSSHILVRTWFVAMGIEVAKVLIRNLYTTHRSRESYEAALFASAERHGVRLPALAELRRDQTTG